MPMPPTDHTNDWDSAEEQHFRDSWLEAPPTLDGQILLAEYSPFWPDQYARLAATIRDALGDRILQLEHIGSTSVPGLAAKPIIDILLVLADPALEATYVPPLEHAGFRLVLREPSWYEHRLFRRGPDPNVNLHVHPPASPEITRWLHFRDHLRTTPADRALYEQTKRRLAAARWRYVQQYAEAKTEVIEAILARALPVGG